MNRINRDPAEERENRGVVVGMRSLYLVTHPEATHVVEGLVGGWYDSDLTPRGEVQAERIAEEIARRLRPGAEPRLCSSDLRRTRRTAGAIGARLGVDPVLDPGLREQCYGVAEGLPPSTMAHEPPPAEGDRMRHHDGVEGSETRLEVATRVYAAVERVLATGAEHSVVVTHGGAATFVVAAWIGMPVESVGAVRFHVTPGSISVLVEDDVRHDRQVRTLNEVGHLGHRAGS